MSGDETLFHLDATGLRQRSIRGAMITSTAQIVKFCLLFASQILLARLLNPADFGIIAMVAPVLGFVIVMSDLGLGQAITQRPVLTVNQLNSVFWLSNLLTITMTLVLMLGAPLLAALYREPKLTNVAIALASLVGVTGLSMQQSALLNRMMRFSALALAETLAQALGLLVSALAALRGFGYWSLVMGQATATVTTGIVLWGASSWRPAWPSFGGDAFSILRFGGNVTISNIALYLNTVLDNVLIGYYLGAILLGIYDRAWKLVVMPLGQLMAPINRVAVPALARLSGDPGRYKNAFGQMFRLLLLVSLPGLVIGATASQPLIDILFGSRWSAVAPIFSWLCLGSLLTPVNTATFWIYVSQGRARDQMIYGTAAAVINIMTYVVGVHWGLLGVARTSTIVAYILTTPLLFLTASRTGPIGRNYFFGALYPFLFSTLGSAIGVALYLRFLHARGVIDLFALLIIAYGATIPVLACFSSGRATLKEALNLAQSLRREPHRKSAP